MIEIKKITKDIFKKLEKYLIDNDFAYDKDHFSVIKNKLAAQKTYSSDVFAYEAIYVVLASGFKQKTAKIKYKEITNYIREKDNELKKEELLKIFNNQNKINAIIDIWKNKDCYCGEFYKKQTDEEKLKYLEMLPYIGKITKNHLARNLGINCVKYDVWIQKLAVVLYGKINDIKRLNTGKLTPKIKAYCDKMFSEIEKQTNEPIGYIDVVLWKSASWGLLHPNLKEKKLYLDV